VHSSRSVLALALCAVLARPAAASAGEEGEVLGSVSFATSCAPAVATQFERAVALLHSFGYEPAAAAFSAVAEADPRCGLAHWGVAATYYHPLWAAPTPAELAAGRAAAERAAAVGAPTERERAWIAAIGAFYAYAETLDHRTRAVHYRDALAALVERFPEDDEAKIFHALSLLGTAPPKDPTYAQQRRAVEILTPLVPRYPDHPGVAHLVIHALDYPQNAHLALDAARRYARIAPSSAHALHMPSHIFVRLGLWPETIASNLDSAASARLARDRHPLTASFDELHALDYLVYSYLQSGRDDDALAALRRAEAIAEGGGRTFAGAYALAAIPARYRLERSDWRGALALPDLVPGGELSPFLYADAIPVLARAVGAARGGDRARAEAEIARLGELQRKLAAAPPPGPYDWASHVEAGRVAAAGLLARARGQNDEAIRLLTEASALDARVGKHPVTPGSVLPPRELLAEVLLELGRAEEALDQFEATLVEAPNRLRSLVGAARAAALARHLDRARTLDTLVASIAAPSSVRPEVVEARRRLGGS
jgi:tetratricopeptide (TPR) repeat protein